LIAMRSHMQNLVFTLDLPAGDLSWTVACSFLLASLRRRGAVPELRRLNRAVAGLWSCLEIERRRSVL